MTGRVHSLFVREVKNGRDTDYVAECSCGWVGLPWTTRVNAAAERCEVFEAERAGAERRAKYRGLAQSA